MAEKAPEPVTREDKITQAKKLYANGYRNYVVGDFNEAAEDLSRSCELYAELFGDESEEVAVPNLFYGKTLIELAQMGENKLLALPDIEEEEEEGDDDDDDDNDDGDGKQESMDDVDENDESGGKRKAEKSNSGHNGNSSVEPQPGTSSGIRNGGNNGATEIAEAEANENLQFAWEALEMAAKIFRRLGEDFEEYLAEAHYGLGEILMENQNCSEAIRDYNTAFELFSKVVPIKERCLAEIKYKTGLCHYTTMAYDTSIADFEQSANYMNQAIEATKTKEQTPEIQKTIEDLTTMREDILNKIAEVLETKQLLRNNLMSKSGGYTALLAEDVKSKDAANESSNAQPEKPKANDISHLIKRKKVDATDESENNGPSPPKKSAP